MGTHPIFESDFDCLTGMSSKVPSRTSGLSLARKKQSTSNLSPQVRKLDAAGSMRSSTLIKTSSPSAPKKVTSRASASALHLGKSACTIPEHDDMFKRNEKLKEALKKEKESVQAIRDEYEERESKLIREKAILDQKIDELLRERTQAATRHNEELQLLNQKHREKQGAVELSHQKEISELIAKYENIIMEKQKAIDTLKAQIAQMMQGQSSTRQAQIEELRKKLISAAKEANDLKTEILKYRKSTNTETPKIQIGVCMNCIVIQQALTMANTALKEKMIELKRIEDVGKGIRLGLEMNDLALDSIEKNIEK